MDAQVVQEPNLPSQSDSGESATTAVTPRSEFFAAAKLTAPILLGVFPFAVVSGVAAVSIGLPPIEAIGMSLIVFAGASQLVSIQLFSAGVPLPVIILSGLIVNLRLLMYSAAIAPNIKEHSPRWKMLLAYMLTDQAFAVSISHFTSKPDQPHKQWYLFGTAFAMWLTWQIGTMIGIFIGGQLPASWSLDFAIPLSFLALVMPTLRDKASISAAMTGGLVALILYTFPFKLGLTIASIIGIAVGLFVENYTTPKVAQASATEGSTQ
jgi:4-azaleucine resistance transporter AzlC